MTKLEKIEAEMVRHQHSNCPQCLRAVNDVNGRVCSLAVELTRAAREAHRKASRRR
jgi:hypothetical protein